MTLSIVDFSDDESPSEEMQKEEIERAIRIANKKDYRGLLESPDDEKSERLTPFQDVNGMKTMRLKDFRFP